MSTQTPNSRLSQLPSTPTGRVVGGKYEIVRALAEGGMGSVYIARHVLTRIEVALKLMHLEASRDESAVERFLREVRFAAEIGHPGIVKVYDAGEDGDGTLFLAMELLAGEDMAERLARPGTTALQGLELLMQVLEPLAAAHERGIVHRDLKPENIFVARAKTGREEVKLLDFGIARQVGVSSKTSAGTGLGTTHYMAPEQASNARDVLPTSDVWALGVILYEAISGQLPFDGQTIHEVIIKAYAEPHAPLQERIPGIDPRLASLVDRCLQKSAAQRPLDAGVLLAELEPLLNSPDVRASLAGGRGGARAGEGRSSVPVTGRVSGAPAFAATALAVSATDVDLVSRASGVRKQSEVPSAPWSVTPPERTSEPVAQPAAKSRVAPIAVLIAAVLALGGAAAWYAMRTPDVSGTARDTSAAAQANAAAAQSAAVQNAAAQPNTAAQQNAAAQNAAAQANTAAQANAAAQQAAGAQPTTTDDPNGATPTVDVRPRNGRTRGPRGGADPTVATVTAGGTTPPVAAMPTPPVAALPPVAAVTPPAVIPPAPNRPIVRPRPATPTPRPRPTPTRPTAPIVPPLTF